MSTQPRPSGTGSPQQSQLVCHGCRTMLLYPNGAQNVRCARCSHINPVSQSSDMAQLSCCNPNCRVQLMYPRGATQVQCSLCGTMNDAQQANQLGHVMCNGCQVTLMYAYGAQSVKCAVCHAVTPVNSETAVGGGSAASGGSLQQQQEQHATVVVENPSGTQLGVKNDQ